MGEKGRIDFDLDSCQIVFEGCIQSKNDSRYAKMCCSRRRRVFNPVASKLLEPNPRRRNVLEMCVLKKEILFWKTRCEDQLSEHYNWSHAMLRQFTFLYCLHNLWFSFSEDFYTIKCQQIWWNERKKKITISFSERSGSCAGNTMFLSQFTFRD